MTKNVFNVNQFYPVYQPIINISEGRVESYEVLTRWDSESLSMSVEALFESLTDKQGLELSLAMLSKALEHDDSVHYNFNLSAGQLVVPGSVSSIVDAIAQSNAQPKQVRIEITEVGHCDETQLVNVVNELLDHGIFCSLDDFGVGENNYQRLLNTNLCQVKLDRQFITGIDVDERKTALLKHLISFIPLLGCELVVEGVETASQMAFVKSLGVTHAQGYWISRPHSTLAQCLKGMVSPSDELCV